MPASLRKLTFGDKFNQPINPGCLPVSLRNLFFGYRFDQPINPCCLPASLEKIYFNNNCIEYSTNIDINVELNYNYICDNLPTDRVINIFHDDPYDPDYFETLFLERYENLYKIEEQHPIKKIGDQYNIRKYRLTPKNILCRNIKSAKMI